MKNFEIINRILEHVDSDTVKDLMQELPEEELQSVVGSVLGTGDDDEDEDGWDDIDEEEVGENISNLIADNPEALEMAIEDSPDAASAITGAVEDNEELGSLLGNMLGNDKELTAESKWFKILAFNSLVLEQISEKEAIEIIRESLNEAPRMSGVMNPEDPSVMADLEKRRSMTNDDVWVQNNRNNIDFAIMLIDEQEYERQEVEDILAHEPGNETISDADIEKIYSTALIELGA